jgi:phosphoribosylformylglycinamidine synthase
VLDALKFGDPAAARTRHLVRGVVRGIAGYGNCVGVPTVGGEIAFHPGYAENPLVNVMAVGVLEERLLTRAAAPGPGNLALLFGSATGRDGIGGASVLASANFEDASASKRPTVQVGDPFAEKLLIEASLELIERGLVAGLQDLGAAGITCAVAETADRAGTGIRVDLDAIPRREPGMEPWEVMISESQERMLAIVEPPRLEAALEVCARWGVPGAVIGQVTADNDIRIVTGADASELARIPAGALTSDAIVYQRAAHPPARSRAAPAPGLPPVAHDGLPERGMDPGAVLLSLLGSAELSSRAWITTQYDATVGSDTVEGNEHGAAVVRIKGTRKALVMATDSQPGVAALDPWLGAAMAVAECARNVAVTGARPLGVTNCLNYGDPTKPDAFWQLSEGVRGIADACRALGLPVTGGNVSLYNESPRGRIPPTAQIGVVGLLDELDSRVAPRFRTAGDVVGLLGEAAPGLAGSAYATIGGVTADDGPPPLDLGREAALLRLLHEAAGRHLLVSAHDVSGGGLGVALAESAMWGGIGAELQLAVRATPAAELFGESPSRIVVSVTPEAWPDLVERARACGVPIHRLGTVGGDRLRIVLTGDGATGSAEARGAGVADELDQPLGSLRHAWQAGLARALGDDAWRHPDDRHDSSGEGMR